MSGDAPRVLKRTTMTAVVTLAVFAACSDGPTRPSPPPATPPAPRPASVHVVRVEIVGLDSIQPSESVQYSAIGHQSDGTTRDLTNEASWQATDPSVLTISSTGLATGHNRGEVYLSVSAGASGGSRNVMVLPSGTYRLAGTVKDEGTGVAGARVEITAGAGRGFAAITDIFGSYSVYGVAGDIEVRVTRTEFQELRRSLRVTSHQTAHFDLSLSWPRPDVAGTYPLTVTADAACGAELPEEVRARTYTAVVRQAGPRVMVTLEGSTFYPSPGGTMRNTFGGVIDPNGIRFVIHPAIGYYYYYEVSVLEALSPGMFFQFSGTAGTTLTPGNLSGVLSGRVETVRSIGDDSFETVSLCASNRHQFVLSR
jgi:Carboxypeptidase regulatory-like domain